MEIRSLGSWLKTRLCGWYMSIFSICGVGALGGGLQGNLGLREVGRPPRGLYDGQVVRMCLVGWF